MSYRTIYIRASEVRKAARDLESFGELTPSQLRSVIRQLRGLSGRIFPYQHLEHETIIRPRGEGNQSFGRNEIRRVITYAAHCHAENTDRGCSGCEHCTGAAGMIDQDGEGF